MTRGGQFSIVNEKYLIRSVRWAVTWVYVVDLCGWGGGVKARDHGKRNGGVH